MEEFTQQLEALAEAVVLADAADLRTLVEIQDQLQALGDQVPAGTLPGVSEACQAAAADIQEFILQDGDNSVELLGALSELINALQHVASGSCDPVRSEIPARFAVAPRTAVAGAQTLEEPAAPESAAAFGADEELVAEFLTEGAEHLQNAEAHLLDLESDAEDSEALNAIFRAFHTIKGGAGFLDLKEVQALAHESETLLDRARAGEVRMAGEYIDITFEAVDALKQLLRQVAQRKSGESAIVDGIQLEDLIQRIQQLVYRGATGNTEVVGSKPGKRLGEILLDEQKATPELLSDALRRQTLEDNQKLGQLLIATGQVEAKDVAKALRAQQAAPAATPQREPVKVDADRLDRLVDLLGELVIAESMVSQNYGSQGQGNQESARDLCHLNKITRELQEIGMTLRMVPLRGTFQKMSRLVRDVAKKSGKRVELKVEGDHYELDKAMVDQIGDPLMHMLRNAVDHGIEPNVQARADAGKPSTGVVTLHAYYKGSNVYIEVADDGRGLDRQVLLSKAREKGIVAENAALSDTEIYNLIFHPGFSTAEKVTDVSGRGVGMDVVRRNIAALRGQVEIDSRLGQGTTISIRLPLTLGIIDGMVVRVGEERFIVPTLSVITALRPQADTVKSVLQRGELILFRESPINLVRLGNLLEVRSANWKPEESILLVVEAGGRMAALMCDELLGQQQTVIKPLGSSLEGIEGISGAAILPDGRAGIILDVEGLIRTVDKPLHCSGERHNAVNPVEV